MKTNPTDLIITLPPFPMAVCVRGSGENAASMPLIRESRPVEPMVSMNAEEPGEGAESGGSVSPNESASR